MAITFNETTRIFTLTTAHTTYQMQADAQGYLLHLYYGARTAGEMDYLLNYGDRGFLEIRIQQAATEPILWMHCHRNIHHLAQEISEIMR